MSKRKAASLLLALALCLCLLPASALAADREGQKFIIKTGNALYPEYDVTKVESWGYVHVKSGEPLNISLENVKWSLQTLSGETIDQDTFADKTVVLVFYKAVLGENACARSARMISGLVGSTWTKRDDVQVIAVDANRSDASMVAAYKAEYAPDCDDIIFAVGGNSLLWKFVRLQDPESSSITYTYCAIIKDKVLHYGLNMVDNATACKLRLIQLLGEEAFDAHGVAASGSLGSICWELDAIGVLTISGTGEIPAEWNEEPPWERYKDEILCIIVEDGVTGPVSWSMRSLEYLSGVVFGEGVTGIGSSAFRGCEKLASVTIPASVTSIARSAFYNCTSLAEVYYGGSEAQWNALDTAYSGIPNNAVIRCMKLDPTGTAYANTQTVSLDGKSVTFEIYALRDASGNDTNYIKVRDLALALNGTAAQFEVDWDGVVSLWPGRTYTIKGVENHTPFSGNRAYKLPEAPTNVNGSASGLQAFVLTDDDGGEYTYYKLRDLGQALGFNVGYDEATDTVYIQTDKPYDSSN